MILRRCSLGLAATLVIASGACYAEPAPFDLAGPTLESRITRAGTTLPVAEVPNLAFGDQVWIKADLPATQEAHYLLVVAFLRGSTNPPPPSWFFRCATWAGKCAEAGLQLSVPQGAQQVLVFLAPETSGDFRTLVSAVRGRPGAFVRTSQDLNQATLDRARLEAYLSAIRALNESDQTRLKAAAPLLARSLAIKVDEKCLDRIPELQAPCLMQGQESLILNDGHSTSIVEALTSGPAGDLAMEASYTPQLSYGYYSPYIASVMDIARIMESFHTAHYQYIPALAAQQGERMALALNTPPSFHDPKSVLVGALPAVEAARLPPLHAVDPREIYCARKGTLVLPVEGAPLVFSTAYAHEVVLSLKGKDGTSVDLPARADAEQGGFVVDTAAMRSAALGDSLRGSLHGRWGFEDYAGPSFELVNAHAQSWQLAPKDEGALIVGREETVHLQASSVSCIDGIMLKDAAGKELKVDWKPLKSNEVEVKLPLQGSSPGAVTLLVSQYGATQPQPVALHAFAEAGHLDRFLIHAGDARGVLKGSRLDEVASVTLKGIEFAPGSLATGPGGDELTMLTQDTQAATVLQQSTIAQARVTLKDGRAFDLGVSVDAPRPAVSLIGKSVQPAPASADSRIQLASADELPQGARLTFSVRALSPARFTRDEKLEVATLDGAFVASLGLADGGLMLEDAEVAVATLDPAKSFGTSAFGLLHFRAVANGIAGDWIPLATLVRLPVLTELKCPASTDLACKLSGSDLFLVDSLASDRRFEHPVQVPDGFPGFALPVPHPTEGQLYLKLRDDPTVINSATLTAQQLPPSSAEAERAPARHAAAQAAAGSSSKEEGDSSQQGHAAPGAPPHPNSNATDQPAQHSGATPPAEPLQPSAAAPTGAPQAFPPGSF